MSAKSPFRVDVVALRRHPGTRETLHTSGKISGLAVTGCAVPQDGVVSVDVMLEAVEGGVLVQGRVAAPYQAECRRCLRALEGEAAADVDAVFVAQPEEGETWPIRGTEIDLEPLARESIVLELPLAPLCSPSCRGLCPVCGADLNLGPCACPG